MMKKAINIILVLALGLVFFSGCGKKEPGRAAIQDIDAPEWVVKGSGAFDEGDDGIFYGVGSAYGIKNPSLLRSTADNRAISSIGKVFKVYTASLMKDYMASTIADDPTVSSEEQHVEQAIKTVTDATLHGVVIVDHWQNSTSGEYFSLAKLDMEKFMDKLEKLETLDAKVKEHIKKNANRLHDELNAELEKQK
jgi:hypothetical protein